MAWSHATPASKGEEPADALGAQGARLSSGFGPQEAANAAWPPARLARKGALAAGGLGAAATSNATAPDPQDAANAARAAGVAPACGRRVPGAAARQCLRTAEKPAPQNASNGVWATAKALMDGTAALRAICGAPMARPTAMDPQNPSNSVWPCAVAWCAPAPSLDAAASECTRKLPHLHPQCPSNSGWGHASAAHLRAPATRAASRARPAKLPGPDLMETGNTAWAPACPRARDDTLFDRLFDDIFAGPEDLDPQAVHAICCATWALSRGELAWELLERRAEKGLGLDATSYGFLLMHGSWSGHQDREDSVLSALASVAPVSVLRPTVARWMADVERAAPARIVRSPSDGQAWYRYQKLGLLVGFVEATLLDASPQAVLTCIESFVSDTHQRWLKIAGGPKADVIDASVRARPLSPFEVGVEMGCFVGYTAVRLGWRLGEPGAEAWGVSLRPGVVSTELESVHVCIARHHVDAARLAAAAEVWPGHIPWATPRYVEQFGGGGVGFTFMDHKGTRFHADLADCKASGVLPPKARLLCDNVLKPGAPEHLWRHHGAPWEARGAAAVWLLHEFMEPECEDRRRVISLSLSLPPDLPPFVVCTFPGAAEL